MLPRHLRIAALQCNFQTEDETLAMPARWREIGFDVAEAAANPYSVLFDMGVGSDAILREWLAPRLNAYGLLPSAEDAFALRDTATSWAREHAPFCLWRVFLRDVEQCCQ